MSTLDIFKDVPLAELADWMTGHPGGRMAVISTVRWSSAWRVARSALSAGKVVNKNGGERVDWPNGATAYVLPLHPWGDAFRGRDLDALCIVDGEWSDLTARQREAIAPCLWGPYALKETSSHEQ